MAFEHNQQGEHGGDAHAASKAAEQGRQAGEAARDGVNRMVDLQEQAAESARHIMQAGLDTATHQAREAAERLTKAIGYSREDSREIAEKTRRDMEAVGRCGTVLTQAMQDTSRGYFEMSQRQWLRGLDGMNRMARASSLIEVVQIQGEMMRDGLKGFVDDSRAITDASMRAADEARQAIASSGT